LQQQYQRLATVAETVAGVDVGEKGKLFRFVFALLAAWTLGGYYVWLLLT